MERPFGFFFSRGGKSLKHGPICSFSNARTTRFWTLAFLVSHVPKAGPGAPSYVRIQPAIICGWSRRYSRMVGIPRAIRSGRFDQFPGMVKVQSAIPCGWPSRKARSVGIPAVISGAPRVIHGGGKMLVSEAVYKPRSLVLAYSSRRATMGSMREARRAGSQLAAMATNTMVPVMAEKTPTSSGRTPRNRFATRCASP